jgi:hypothetical protein
MGTGRVLSEIIEQRESDRAFPASVSPFTTAERRKTRICRSFGFIYFFLLVLAVCEKWREKLQKLDMTVSAEGGVAFACFD